MKKWQLESIFLAVYDAVIVNASYFVLLWNEYGEIDFIPKAIRLGFLKWAPIYGIICICIFYFFKMYQLMWKFVGSKDFKNCLLANCLAGLINMFAFLTFSKMSFLDFLCGFLFQLVFIIGIRFLYPIVRKFWKNFKVSV